MKNVIIGIVLVVISFIAGAMYMKTQKDMDFLPVEDVRVPQEEHMEEPDEVDDIQSVEISGTVTAVELMSMVDGPDYLVVDNNQRILVNPGFVINTYFEEHPQGSIINGDTNDLPEVGDMIEAYVKYESENNYSLFGSPDYYIKVVGIAH